MSVTVRSNETARAEPIVLYDLPPDAEQQIQDALGPEVVRRGGEGVLEIPRLLAGVTPEAYRKFLEALPEHRFPHSYDGETLEMMTIGRGHEWVRKLLGRLLEAMVFALDIPIQSTGCTTLRTAMWDTGLEPDETYYVGEHVAAVASETYEPGVDPPPDLAIEVEATNPVVPRLPLFAAIGVREIWRWTGEEMEFLRLTRGRKYAKTQRSLAFPFVSAADVTRFVQKRDPSDENAVVRGFVKWARKAYKEQRAGGSPK
jgi:Uma2 family endonuclease